MIKRKEVGYCGRRMARLLDALPARPPFSIAWARGYVRGRIVFLLLRVLLNVCIHFLSCTVGSASNRPTECPSWNSSISLLHTARRPYSSTRHINFEVKKLREPRSRRKTIGHDELIFESDLLTQPRTTSPALLSRSVSSQRFKRRVNCVDHWPE